MTLTPLPASPFLPRYRGREADSLLIAASSFERRCLGFVSFLAQQEASYRAEQVVLLNYDDRGDALVRQRVARHRPELEQGLRRIASTNVIGQQSVGPYAVYDAIDTFGDLFRSVGQDASVVVDVSTMPKLHMLYLLRAAANSTRISSLRLVYTRARYGRFDTLSRGAEEPLILPYFGQAPDGEARPIHLVLFCGLEPGRSYVTWRRLGQHCTTKVFIDSGPDDTDRCASRAMQLHDFAPSARQVVLGAFDVEATVQFLEEVYEQCQERKEYMYIAPFTTKWELLSVWEFFNRCKERQAGIAYAAPGRLNASGHTLDRLGEVVVAEVRVTPTP
jgi:hypothetical protein